MNRALQFREWHFRQAFSRWLRGECGVEAFPAGQERGLRWAGALALAEAGSAAEAVERLCAPPAAPVPLRASALLWAGRPEEAARLCRESANNPLGVALLGLASLEGGDPVSAAAAWKRQAPAPWRLCSSRALAALLADAHRVEGEAVLPRLIADLQEESEPRPPWPARLFRRGLDLLESLGPWLRSDRGALDRIQVLSLATRGELPAALALAGRLRREFRQETWPRTLLVELLRRQGEDRRILELGADLPELSGHMGLALARLGRWEEAIARLEDLATPEAIHHFSVGAGHALAGRIHESARAFLRLGARDELALVDLLDRETGLFLARHAGPK